MDIQQPISLVTGVVKMTNIPVYNTTILLRYTGSQINSLLFRLYLSDF